jgi:hypothetical protein
MQDFFFSLSSPAYAAMRPPGWNGKTLRVTKNPDHPRRHQQNKTERQLPLPDVLQDILKRRRANIIVGNNFIFTGRSKRSHLVEPKKSVALVADGSGIKWSSHDLRRTCSTIASS